MSFDWKAPQTAEQLERETEELEALICEDMEWGVRPGIAIRERCHEALERAQRRGESTREE